MSGVVVIPCNHSIYLKLKLKTIMPLLGHYHFSIILMTCHISNILLNKHCS